MPLRPGQVIEVTGSTEPLLGFARMIQVRHRSHATYSRQPRQVRKEATVTGSCVCSGSPVPDLIFWFTWARSVANPADRHRINLYTPVTTLCARRRLSTVI